MAGSITRIVTAIVAALLLTFAGVASAQGYPNRPIKLLVPYAPGGSSDTVARQLAVHLTERLKQPVVVENRPGASSIIAVQAMLAAPADGYTIALYDATAPTLTPYLFRKPAYDASKLTPVATLVKLPLVLMVNPSFPAQDLQQFIQYVKANPGTSYASAGFGNPPQMNMERLRKLAGLEMTHVPYKGAAPALQDVMAGQVAAVMMDIPSSIQMIKAGKLKALAVTSLTRSALLPSVATVAESGFPNFDGGNWFGMFVAKGTPDPIVARLGTALRESIESKQFDEWAKSMALVPAWSTSSGLGELVKQDGQRYHALVQDLGIYLD